MPSRTSSSSIEELGPQSPVSVDESDHSEVEEVRGRGKRARKIPSKLKDSVFNEAEYMDAQMKNSKFLTLLMLYKMHSYPSFYVEKVCVKCNQSGKLFKVKVTTLERTDDECLKLEDLVSGSQLYMIMDKKPYPVTVQSIMDPEETGRM